MRISFEKEHSMKLPHIHIIATGGTIAAHETSAMQTTGYSGDNLLLANELIRSIEGIEAHAEITAENIFSLPSSAMDEAHLLQLARRVNELLADPAVDGLVITHGTDTLEETAFFLYLTAKSPKPVVITGSMLPASAHSADGPGNLINAICTAASRESWGKGVIVCMCNRLLSARDAAKTSTYRLDTFKCLEYGTLGHVVGGDVRFYYAPVRPHGSQSQFDIQALAELPRVEIIMTHENCSEVLLKAAVESGCDGVVAAGMGSGAIPPRMRAYYKALEKKPFLVRASRVYSGYVAAHSATPDLEYDTICAGDFTPIKARLLLQLALTATSDLDEIRSIFQKY